jgi:hypothetical protein
MSNHQKDAAAWAQENGYEYHAGKAEDCRDHVFGIHRDRPFEILDVRVSQHSGDGYFFVWKTIVRIPVGGLNLPDFDLMPRRETGGMNFLGIKGLDLKVAVTAPLDERLMVDAFKKNYSLFGGGARKAMEASIKSADHVVPSLAGMASICKPGVLRFLSTAVTGCIGVQDGRLTIHAPETRMIRPGVSDTILTGRERESLLAVANDFLDVFANSATEAPLAGLQLENTFRPAGFLGAIIGAGIGFFVGVIASIILLIGFKGEHLFLIPLLILGGIFLGRFIGRKVTATM